jgi:hypothetical protein
MPLNEIRTALQIADLKTFLRRIKLNILKLVSILWLSENPYFILADLTICKVSKRIGSKRGRPKKDEQLEKGYLVRTEVQKNEGIIANERSILGRLVLASNDWTL